jgi:hypothetical protein
MKNVAIEEPTIPPKPIAGRLDVIALKRCLDLVDKEELSKALAGRTKHELVEGLVQLLKVSVRDQHYNTENYIQLNDVDFWGCHEYTYGLRWCADKNVIFVKGPTNIRLKFQAPNTAYYLILTYAAIYYEEFEHEAKYQLDEMSGSFSPDAFGDPWVFVELPVLAWLEKGEHWFVFSGNWIVFQSILVCKIGPKGR